MKITKATSIQYVLEEILRADLTGNEVKASIAWLCDRLGFNPTAKQIAAKCNISEPAAQAALKGASKKSILSCTGKQRTPTGKFKNVFTFGSIFKPEKLFESKIDSENRDKLVESSKLKRAALWYVDKWPHISSEAERLLPIAQKYLKYSSPMKKIAKLEGYKNAISLHIKNEDYKHIDFKISSFNDLANEIVYELNDYISDYDGLDIPFFPKFERLLNPAEKKKKKD